MSSRAFAIGGFWFCFRLVLPLIKVGNGNAYGSPILLIFSRKSEAKSANGYCTLQKKVVPLQRQNKMAPADAGESG